MRASLLRWTLVFFLAVALAACGAQSEAPLSDASTSVIDEHLVGRWERAQPEKDARGTLASSGLLVGRHEGSDRTMEASVTEVDGQGRLETKRVLLFATRIGDRTFLSAQGGDGGRYILMRYDLEGEDVVRLALLDEDFVKAQVQAGKIAGRIEKADDLDLLGPTVILTAPTQALREWVAAHADQAFATDDAVRLRRTSPAFHPKGGEEEPPPSGPEAQGSRGRESR